MRPDPLATELKKMIEFRIALSFNDSLSRLTAEEQKHVKLTVYDLQQDPSNPGHKFHKLGMARDTRFWSVRVSADIRLIVHRIENSLLVCYVDHHDKAYEWAERRKLSVHPRTGAAQIVEIRETVETIVIKRYVDAPDPAARTHGKPLAPVLSAVSVDDLLSYGVPAEWVDDVRAATENELLAIAEHLPAEAAEAVLELATGGKPRVPETIAVGANPFDHPDAQRRFRVFTDVSALQAALEYPWEKWTVFLHPDQRQLVDRTYSGPARVAGSAGTGKTIVALHRAAYLARANPDARVLLTTFSDTLANALQTKLRRLLVGEPRLAERIDVYSLDAIAIRLHKAHVGSVSLATREQIVISLTTAAQSVGGHKFGSHFLRTEWDQVVDAWQLDAWEAYRDVARLGRKTRLPEAQRNVLWQIFAKVKTDLAGQGLRTASQIFTALAAALQPLAHPAFDFVIVDESQDLSISHLRFLAALGASRPNALFFAGDLGQRIFQQPFSWKALGVDIRGRSKTLRVNYRTSHQIRQQADRLLGEVVTDVDGNTEDRRNTVSVFNGPAPVIRSYHTEADESAGVGAWIAERIRAGLLPHEFGVFVRSAAQLPRARAAVIAGAQPFVILDEHVETASGKVSICTMHLAKGLEFRAVIVMACDDEVIPLQERIESVGDDGDLKDAYETERQLLYVACTRARDQLLITSVAPQSEFVDDMKV
jgi:mRNA-degrading endonuclease RelE of RelBE toxin-antitoxin system